MSAPHRIVYGAQNAYALDPYVRDDGGRFARKPTQPLPPLAELEASARRVDVVDLSNGNGAVFVSRDGGAQFWRVRTVRETDGTFRVIYLEP